MSGAALVRSQPEASPTCYHSLGRRGEGNSEGNAVQGSTIFFRRVPLIFSLSKMTFKLWRSIMLRPRQGCLCAREMHYLSFFLKR